MMVKKNTLQHVKQQENNNVKKKSINKVFGTYFVIEITRIYCLKANFQSNDRGLIYKNV